MASIIGKTIKGHTYYYVREVARVGGKPKVISQRYLGKVADIEAAMAGATVMPDRTRHLAFDDLAAVWSMLERLKVAEIIDEVVGSRRTDAAASIGTYIALATANRVVDPCSKRKLSDWWKNTSGDRLLRLPLPSTTGAFGTRWTPSAKTSCKRSSVASSLTCSKCSPSTSRDSCST
jgi:hypothetical protein